mgnify:CR=1 FL=1
MKYREKFSKEREAREKIRVSNRNRDCLRWSSGESNAHIQRKLDICKILKKQGKEFYTECIFDNGEGRADICVVEAENPRIYEIYETETKESLEVKKAKYPDIFEIIFVSASEKFKEEDLEWKEEY